jgi:putative FmdB family regulatory protein
MFERSGGPVPTYQYSCTECGEPLEAVQSFSDPALTECPKCGGQLRKRFNSVGIVFKGSGFYRNDSRSGTGNGGDKPTEKSDTKSESKPAESTTSSSDSKTAKPAASTTSSTTTSSGSSGGAKAGAASS